MAYDSLADFLDDLEKEDELRRIKAPVDPSQIAELPTT